ncbi:MAG: acyl-CoA reductase [Flavobacteriia bacterium]|nr:acyl-CoA reductase [Flavobacteriia bacterium]OIP45205.1 MAG: acyl-CoA reductase [Flavobacteriaceae bacterium CG2_30_31_66]PIV97545.1 MAG: acyl-CoA reductase [Flavobacteriaceae bacterium CG17_big_fil_post_rev_8_21_14_2_50_31_13]PIY14663.1 MAG: acyl-CoA reductase [Flavobacteriaceae bacterium CG_4_10_14_3_um_filter_31_253]PIZ10105.1 MAG: acyl-CoA reductase [Flavobacteriaceae bacterium CG_4_10_14_0_8_um_filter_31_99]PJC10232.1 MAG: acyl-CoA reductase [Flavobacteriaceae bacterium CG_4_9_14_0_8_u
MELIKSRLYAFNKLGLFLSQFSRKSISKATDIDFNELFFDGFLHQMKLAQENNSWFTEENLLLSIENWTAALQKSNLETWVSRENLTEVAPKKVAIIMAGNIPLVGFHDFLSVLISGHDVLVKQSSNDKHLLPFLAKYLEYIEPTLKDCITFIDDKLTDFDAVIATGSNNTARYFEYYFGNKPNIIRKSRNSVAVITGNETEEDFKNLADDIFTYFGLGCRSVSKLYVPREFDFNLFFNGIYEKKDLLYNAKYANNYDYNKAVYLMSEFDLLENGFLMIKEDESYSSPIATVFYEYYDNPIDLKIKLYQDKDKIQCVVSKGFLPNETRFGKTQNPELWDYADGINTLTFLSEI